MLINIFYVRILTEFCANFIAKFRYFIETKEFALMKYIVKFASAAVLLAILTGCSAKQEGGLFNLSPEAWNAQIISDITSRNLENADKHYISFSSEHIASPILEQTTLILAHAHMEREEYKLANFYLDEYIKRYGTAEKIEYAEFLKIKANFDSFLKPNRNQKLMQNTIIEIRNFLVSYPNTMYRPLVDTMLTKFKLAEYYLNENIKNLYNRTGRDESAKIYEHKLEDSSLKDANLIPPQTPWYTEPFE